MYNSPAENMTYLKIQRKTSNVNFSFEHIRDSCLLFLSAYFPWNAEWMLCVQSGLERSSASHLARDQRTRGFSEPDIVIRKRYLSCNAHRRREGHMLAFFLEKVWSEQT